MKKVYVKPTKITGFSAKFLRFKIWRWGSFILVCVALEFSLVHLAWWQHQRMLEKQELLITQTEELNLPPVTDISPSAVGRKIKLDEVLDTSQSIFLVHQKYNEMGGWRLLVPLLNQPYWLDMGWFPPQKDMLNPDFSIFKQTKFTGMASIVETPIPHGWLSSPVKTAHPRVWNRLDKDKIGPLYLVALENSPFYTGLPEGLSANRHKNYRNTWAVLSFILPFLMLLFLRAQRRKRG